MPNSNLEVEDWFAAMKHPLEQAMRRVREIILGADPRMTECMQYRTLHFVYEADLASFVQLTKKHLTLMFNTGARIPGRFPHLEGDGPNARFMRFADLAEVEARAAELRATVAAWCAFKTPATGETQPAARATRGVKAPSKKAPARRTRAAR